MEIGNWKLDIGNWKEETGYFFFSPFLYRGAPIPRGPNIQKKKKEKEETGYWIPETWKLRKPGNLGNRGWLGV